MPVPIPFTDNGPVLKATLFFSDGRFTWSESYYGVGDTDLKAFVGRANALSGVRKQLLGDSVSIFLVRVSDDKVQRDSVVWENGDPGFAGGYATANKGQVVPPAEPPYSCVLVRCEGRDPISGAVGGYRKSIYMSGWPQQDIRDPVGPILSAQSFANFLAFRTYVTKNGWGFLAFRRNADTFGPFQVTKASSLGAGSTNIAITIDPGKANPAIAAKDVVQLQRFKAPAVGGTPGTQLSLNGTYRVDSVVGNVINIIFPGNPADYNFSTPGGTLVKRERWIVPFYDLSIRTETHRKRGGRVFLPLGKSKTRK